MTNDALFQLYFQIDSLRTSVVTEIRKRNIDWQHLATSDLSVEAVLAYRTKHNVSISEAKAAVDSFRAMLK